jgi:hypothetical protein
MKLNKCNDIFCLTLEKNSFLFYSENRMRKNLTDMRRLSISVFHHIFFESEEYALVTNDDEQQSDSLSESTNHASLQTIQSLRNKLSIQLGDWFSFIEIKSQRNITMSLFVFSLFEFSFSLK